MDVNEGIRLVQYENSPTDDNKVMMNTAHSERPNPQLVINIEPSSQAGTKKKNYLRKLRTRLRTSHIIDIILLILVGALMGLIEFGYIPNAKLGFICEDPKISHQFRGDTISGTVLLSSAFVGPLLIIACVEILREKSIARICPGTIWYYYSEYFLGTLMVLLITEVIKVLIGEHRPHFLASCNPDVNCTAGEFVLDYNCRNKELSRFFRTDMMRSFPSGHTSLSVYAALYSCFIIQSRVSKGAVSRLIKLLAIAACLTYALCCSLSRITDRRHHWWDVLGGAALGACGFYYTISLLRHDEELKKIELSRTNTSTTTLVDVKNKAATSVII